MRTNENREGRPTVTSVSTLEAVEMILGDSNQGAARRLEIERLGVNEGRPLWTASFASDFGELGTGVGDTITQAIDGAIGDLDRSRR